MELGWAQPGSPDLACPWHPGQGRRCALRGQLWGQAPLETCRLSEVPSQPLATAHSLPTLPSQHAALACSRALLAQSSGFPAQVGYSPGARGTATPVPRPSPDKGSTETCWACAE